MRLVFFVSFVLSYMHTWREGRMAVWAKLMQYRTRFLASPPTIKMTFAWVLISIINFSPETIFMVLAAAAGLFLASSVTEESEEP